MLLTSHMVLQKLQQLLTRNRSHPHKFMTLSASLRGYNWLHACDRQLTFKSLVIFPCAITNANTVDGDSRVNEWSVHRKTTLNCDVVYDLNGWHWIRARRTRIGDYSSRLNYIPGGILHAGLTVGIVDTRTHTGHARTYKRLSAADFSICVALPTVTSVGRRSCACRLGTFPKEKVAELSEKWNEDYVASVFFLKMRQHRETADSNTARVGLSSYDERKDVKNLEARRLSKENYSNQFHCQVLLSAL